MDDSFINQNSNGNFTINHDRIEQLLKSNKTRRRQRKSGRGKMNSIISIDDMSIQIKPSSNVSLISETGHVIPGPIPLKDPRSNGGASSSTDAGPGPDSCTGPGAGTGTGPGFCSGVNAYRDNDGSRIAQSGTPRNSNTGISLTISPEYEHFVYPAIKPQTFNALSLINQCMIIFYSNYFLSSPWMIINLLTADSIIGSIIFLANYYQVDVGNMLYQEPPHMRYLYYFIVSSLYLNLKCLLWIPLPGLDRLAILTFSLPWVINRTCNAAPFSKLYSRLHNKMRLWIKLVICKKIANLINRISSDHLNNSPNLKSEELIKFMDIDIRNCISFIGSCLVASLLLYLEMDGAKIYTIMFRQYYFRQYFLKKEESNLDDGTYISTIINKRDWQKLSDPYTLNRLMTLYLRLNESTNGGLLSNPWSPTDSLKIAFQRFMVSWTFYSLFGYKTSGIWSYSLFLWKDRNSYPLTKLLTIAVYFALSFISNEQVLFLLLLEANLLLVSNRLFIGIIKDLKKIAGRELATNRQLKLTVEHFRGYWQSNFFFWFGMLYWPTYYLTHKFLFNWELTGVLILVWIFVRLKNSTYGWPFIVAMFLANLWGFSLGGHPAHLFILNLNIDIINAQYEIPGVTP